MLSMLGEEEQAQHLLEHVVQKAQSLHMGAQARVALAERIYRVLGDLDQVRIWVEDLPQPELATAINLDLGVQPFLQRFRLNRLLYTLGSQASPKEIVPDAQDPDQQGMVYFERAICTIARLWADGWRGRKMDKKTFVNEARPILHFFSWHQNTNRQWSLWYVIKEAQAEFFTLLRQRNNMALRLLKNSTWHSSKNGMIRKSKRIGQLMSAAR